MPLEIEERRMEPDIMVVDLAGRLEMGREGQRIEVLVEAFAKRGIHKVILDMTKVTYIDSAGIGLIALASGRLKETAGQLVVVAPKCRVLELLVMTQVNRIGSVLAALPEAAQVFGVTEPQATA
jgi:anti-sigma B factor antagonist